MGVWDPQSRGRGRREGWVSPQPCVPSKWDGDLPQSPDTQDAAKVRRLGRGQNLLLQAVSVDAACCETPGLAMPAHGDYTSGRGRAPENQGDLPAGQSDPRPWTHGQGGPLLGGSDRRPRARNGGGGAGPRCPHPGSDGWPATALLRVPGDSSAVSTPIGALGRGSESRGASGHMPPSGVPAQGGMPGWQAVSVSLAAR